jgi:hypothetical protein
LGVALIPAPLGQVTISNPTYRPIIEANMSADLLPLSRVNETNVTVRAVLALARKERENRESRQA